MNSMNAETQADTVSNHYRLIVDPPATGPSHAVAEQRLNKAANQQLVGFESHCHQPTEQPPLNCSVWQAPDAQVQPAKPVVCLCAPQVPFHSTVQPLCNCKTNITLLSARKKS